MLCIGYRIRKRIWSSIPNTTADSPSSSPSMDMENSLLEQDNIIDFPLKSRDLSRYDEVLYA